MNNVENALSSDENIWVVLPTHDRKELLRESLTALRTQTHKPAHVLVVLNASPPEVTLMLESEFPEIELLRLDKNLGSAGGFHFGIKRALEAGAGWVWLMDDDAIAEPDSLERLLTALKQVEVFSPDPDILLSRVVWTDGRIHPMNFPWLDWRRLPLLWKALNWGFLLVRSGAWAGMLVRTSAVQRHGLPIKDYFVWCEDLDFSGRILRRGVGYWVFDSVVVHKTKGPTAAVGDYGERFFFEVRNRIWLLRSNAFGVLGKLAWTIHFAGELLFYLWATRGKGLGVVRRGFVSGFRSKPKE